MRVSVKGDIMHLDKPAKIWQDNFRQFDKSNELLPVVMGKDRLSAVGKKPAKKVRLLLFAFKSWTYRYCLPSSSCSRYRPSNLASHITSRQLRIIRCIPINQP